MIKLQIKLLFSRINFYAVLLLCTVMSVVYFRTVLDSPLGPAIGVKAVSREFLYWGNYYTGGFKIFKTIFPFLLVVPFATSYIDDLSKKTCAGMFIRGSRMQYIIGKYAATFIGNFLFIFIPFLLNLVLCFTFYEPNRRTPFGDIGVGNIEGKLYGTISAYKGLSDKMLFADLLFDHPFLFYFLYLILLSLLSAFLGVFVMSVSMWMKKGRILLFLPVYLIMRIADTYTDWSFNRAVSNPNKTFINLDLMDYVAPFGVGHCYYPILAGVFIFIILFAAISGAHMYRRAELK